MSDAQLSIDDEKARSDALDISRSFVVQAPAGSGKTELLIQRYLRLLACVDHPEEILAITFTRKAALEMQNRVNAALQDAMRKTVVAQAHQRYTLELAGAALEKDRALGWRLVDSPRRMRIQTLDSFCAGMAKSLPVSSGLGGSVSTLADAEMHAMYRQAAAATLDWLIAENEESDIVACLLEHLDINTSVYIEHLARMLETRDQWLTLIGSGMHQDSAASSAARRRLEANIEATIVAQLQRLLRAFNAEFRDALLPLLRYAAAFLTSETGSGHPLAMLHDADDLPGDTCDDLPAWRAVAGLLLTQEGNWRKTVNKNDGFPPKDQGEKKAMLALLTKFATQHELQERLQKTRKLPDRNYTDAQWKVLLALFGLLPIAVVELRRLFSERGVTDHTEVALAASKALGDEGYPGDAALLLDCTIRHILVDEMQDTSIGQYQLIEKLIAGWNSGDGRTLFCVGDPMQSIYRFRNAEVGRFLQIRESGIGDVALESLVLRRNFRSGANLVHRFNTVFSQVFPHGDDHAEGAVRYSESVPVQDQRGKGEWTVHALFGASAEEEAHYASDIVRQFLTKDPEQTSAVLVRSRTQLPELLSQLRAAGIEYRAVEIDRLTDLPEIIDVMALTRALCHEGDRLAWLSLLRGPWVGLRLADLHSLVFQDTASTIWELLTNADRLPSLSDEGRQRVTRFVETIGKHRLHRLSESLRDRIEVAWFALGGPALMRNGQELENVYRFFDVLEKIESTGTLVDVADLDARLDDERVSTLVDSPGALQVMTMHKAKGLEFDHVMLYAMGRSTRSRPHSVMSWMNLADSQNESAMLLSPIGPRSELESDPLHQYIEIAESEKERHELDRLLYVACTRARISLHLVGSVPIPVDRATFKAPPDNSLLGRMWPAIEHDFAQAFANGGGVSGSIVQSGATFAAPRYRRFREPFRLPDPPALPVRPEPDTVGDSMQGVEYYWVGMAARHAGTIVHRWLKKMTTGSLEIDQHSVSRLRPATLRLAVEMGVPETALQQVCERVEQALLGVLSDRRGRWLVSGEGHSELPLSGRWEDRQVSIVIDRIRIDDGVHWIVDYKTSSHEGGDLERFLAGESERYRSQLQKYAVLYQRMVNARVKTALYFPLLQEFREVTVD